MKHRIDPTVDCVFKAILGSESNKISLVHFLNAVMKPREEERIQEATVLNPYNEREFIDDKLTVVDVRARDEEGRHYQIEIQLTAFSALRQRILYTWSSLYHSLIESGDPFDKLSRTVSIWVLGDAMFKGVDDHHLPFCLYNEKHKLLLSDQMQIHIIQMPEWCWEEMVMEELDRWMYLFTHGEAIDLDHPPEILRIKEMEPVMETMKRFSEKEQEYNLYERRRIAAMTEKAMQKDREELLKEKELVQKEKEVVQQEKEVVQQEKEVVQQEKEVVQQEKEVVQKDREELQKKEQDLQKQQMEMQARLEKELEEKERLLNLLKQAGIDPS